MRTMCVGRCSSGIAPRSKAAVGRFAADGWPAVMSDKFGRVPASSSPPGCLLGSRLLSSTTRHVLIAYPARGVNKSKAGLILLCY